jgi:hypothetical protein
MSRTAEMCPAGEGWFPAKYDGTCRGCGAPIYAGEWIAYSTEGVVACRPCIEKERA